MRFGPARPLVAATFLATLLFGCDDLAGPDSADATAANEGGSVTNTSADACRGTLGAIRVENVNVPSGASCTLAHTVVQGNVFVRDGAHLRAVDAQIGGNIQAEGARSVQAVRGTSVEGNIQVKQGGSATILDTAVDGDVQLEQNRGAIVAESNRVGGNMQVNQNTGGVTLVSNRIAENLQCQANEPRPGGGGNVAGDKEDQCESL